MEHRQHGVREPIPLGDVVAAGDVVPIGHDESTPANDDGELLRKEVRDLFDLEVLARSSKRRAEFRDRRASALERLRQLVPKDVDCLLSLGWLYALRGDHQAAVEVFQDALALAPKSVIALQGIAESYSSLGKSHEARRARIMLDRLGGPAIQ